MTPEKEIHEQVEKDYQRFWQTQYDGELPSGLIYRFRSALMFHTPKTLPGSIHVISELINKKEDDLKFFEVGVIINTIFSVPFNCMYDSPEQAMEAMSELKEIEISYNDLVEKRSKEIERKRERLLKLSGITPNTVSMNGSKFKS